MRRETVTSEWKERKSAGGTWKVKTRSESQSHHFFVEDVFLGQINKYPNDPLFHVALEDEVNREKWKRFGQLHEAQEYVESAPRRIVARTHKLKMVLRDFAREEGLKFRNADVIMINPDGTRMILTPEGGKQ